MTELGDTATVAAVIPARFGSTRFPGKPLVHLCGKPMIQHVYERVAGCPGLDCVVVATDSAEIAAAVTGFGGEVRMTRADHATGTDRVAEVGRSLAADIVLNIQGDEPLLPPEAVAELMRVIRREGAAPMATLKAPIEHDEDFFSPDIVKVVTDRNGLALYFSRAPVPGCHGSALTQTARFRHIGVYAFRREFLFTFTSLARTPLERQEGLEQLRALEHGYAIRVGETDYSPIGVDTPEDVARVERLLSAD